MWYHGLYIQGMTWVNSVDVQEAHPVSLMLWVTDHPVCFILYSVCVVIITLEEIN